MFICETARKFDCSAEAIKTIISKYNLPLPTKEEREARFHKIVGTSVIRCDENWNELEYYESSTLAAQWLIDNNHTRTDNTETVGRRIRQYAAIDKKTYGFFWKMPLISQEAKEQRAVDFIAYRKKYKKSSNAYSKGNKCPICGVQITNQSTFCSKHCHASQPGNRKVFHPLYENPQDEYENLSNEMRVELGMKPILGNRQIGEDDLQELLRFHTVDEIASICGSSPTATIRFIKRYFNIEHTVKYRAYG